MKVNFDTKNDIMRIKFQDGNYEISKEIEDGIVIDMDNKKQILAIEIQNVSTKIPNNNLKELVMDISE